MRQGWEKSGTTSHSPLQLPNIFPNNKINLPIKSRNKQLKTLTFSSPQSKDTFLILMDGAKFRLMEDMEKEEGGAESELSKTSYFTINSTAKHMKFDLNRSSQPLS